MLYPPKKRSYSPEPKKTKDLANLTNINSKFTGSGGSNPYPIQTPHPLPPENKCLSPNHQFLASSEQRSI